MTARMTLVRSFAIASLALFSACGTVSSDSASDAPAQVALSSPAVVNLDVADFTLLDTDGQAHSLSAYVAAGKTVVLEWFNPDCPFVRRYHDAPSKMAGMHEALKDDNLVWLAINSGAEGKQGAGLERNIKAAKDWNLPYPVLLDMDGKTGRAYGAATTPHMFVISPKGELVYEGAIDDSNGRGETKTNYVRQTLMEYRAGKPVSIAKTKSFGCSVKYGK